MGSHPLVAVEHLERAYGTVRAVQDVSFELGQGDVLGFLGPNGAGKSTTMRIVTGSLAPTAGRVAINGVDLLAEPLKAKRKLGFLPEDPPLYRDLTVNEYLRYCARLNGLRGNRLADAVRQARRRCGLDEVGGRLIANLSRGLQQRVGIAQAIIHHPEVVVLDEPTIGLDPIQVREIRDLIRELGQAHGVLLSTHILPEVQAVCNRVQIIHQGQLVLSEDLDALNQRMGRTSLQVTLAHPVDTAALSSIEGVREVEELGEGRYRIHHDPGSDPAEPLAERAVQEGWGLRALVPEERSLEQMFVDLTLKEEAA